MPRQIIGHEPECRQNHRTRPERRVKSSDTTGTPRQIIGHDRNAASNHR
jgi:hypothetical protein